MELIVTGSGQGIGKEVAASQVKTNTSLKILHLISRSKNVFDTAKFLEKQNKNIEIIPHQIDISQPDFIEIFDRKIAGRKPNLLVNAAGTLGQPGFFLSLNPEDYMQVFRVNVIGSLELMKYIMEINEKSAFIRIVNFAGGGAAYSYPKFTPYATSKVAIVRLTETIAEELNILGFHNSRVNCIAPGAVNTKMLEEVKKHGGDVKTTVDVSEPVRLVNFLLSDIPSSINGRFIHSRDKYELSDLFNDVESFKLRRVDNR